MHEIFPPFVEACFVSEKGLISRSIPAQAAYNLCGFLPGLKKPLFPGIWRSMSHTSPDPDAAAFLEEKSWNVIAAICYHPVFLPVAIFSIFPDYPLSSRPHASYREMYSCSLISPRRITSLVITSACRPTSNSQHRFLPPCLQGLFLCTTCNQGPTPRWFNAPILTAIPQIHWSCSLWDRSLSGLAFAKSEKCPWGQPGYL